MRTKNLFAVALICSVIAGCGDRNQGSDFTINAHYSNALHPVFVGDANPAEGKVSKVYLYEVPFGTENAPLALDSATLNNNSGTFQLKGNGKSEGIYELVFNNGFIILVSNDAPQIEVEVDLAKKDNYYSVKGSEATQQMKEFASTYSDYSVSVNRAFNEMDSLKRFQASDSLVVAATAVKNNEIRKLNDYMKKFIAGTSHPAVAIFGLGWASRSFSKEEFESTLATLVNKFSDNPSVQSVKKNYDAQIAQMKDAASKQEEYEKRDEIWTGKMAPDLSMPDTQGRELSISSFRGKYLLVDFWASWCGPCRGENPNLVKAYNQFKDKNFTVLGVSLDRGKDEWIQAIKEDNLTWNHMSDLRFWDSKAVEIFKFDAIPYNVLIGPDGVVIAENLRGKQLEEKLQSVLK